MAVLRKPTNLVLRVMIVEDNALEADELRRYLAAQKQFEIVAVVDNATEAITYLRAHTFIDALVLDLELREGDGMDILEHLQHLAPADRPIILVTTNNRSDSAAVKYARGIGIDYVLEKSRADYGPPLVAVQLLRFAPYKLQDRERRNRRERELATAGPVAEETVPASADLEKQPADPAAEIAGVVEERLIEIGCPVTKVGTHRLRDTITALVVKMKNEPACAHNPERYVSDIITQVRRREQVVYTSFVGGMQRVLEQALGGAKDHTEALEKYASVELLSMEENPVRSFIILFAKRLGRDLGLF
ncbi:LytTR family DNA-binding domain-containing protein [Neobittarella massiliensis]|uniref:Stage 0 sporulation protein A homolog n=1 Tax=Neobittarella massiliensis (ex Bilen et al. 2018) TaxID=2041842 RepID=A0A8J6IKV8_9FIRM|nr:response regulator [Neobittarella massiliensis]MBC3515474.1 response regulator [Neobittarella massiliensis]